MTGEREVEIRGWGGLGVRGVERLGEDLGAPPAAVPLCRGLGRAYGDAALPPPARRVVAGTRLADRILAFDPATGLLRAEAGLSLAEINRLFWPRLFTSPVLTGTQQVTLGGMVAADVHGKNHHRSGSFGGHVERLRIALPGSAGRTLWCSRSDEPELFRATLGGMGLTGHVLEVEARLAPIPSPWIWAEHERCQDLDALLDGLAEAAASWPYTVAWADCLMPRVPGVLFRGRWAEPDEAPAAPPRPKRPVRVPLDAPSWLLNRLTIRIFNRAYRLRQGFGGRPGVVHPETFFHPLDGVDGWNRIYGRRGFTQYQCVLPRTAGRAAVRRFFELARTGGAASFLTVVKDLGAQGEGLLSFPCPGTTVSMDIPIDAGIQALVDRLNALVIEVGGRIYLAKDAFTRAADFRHMEPRIDAFQAVRRRYDPEGLLASAQSERLLAGAPSEDRS